MIPLRHKHQLYIYWQYNGWSWQLIAIPTPTPTVYKRFGHCSIHVEALVMPAATLILNREQSFEFMKNKDYWIRHDYNFFVPNSTLRLFKPTISEYIFMKSILKHHKQP